MERLAFYCNVHPYPHPEGVPASEIAYPSVGAVVFEILSVFACSRCQPQCPSHTTKSLCGFPASRRPWVRPRSGTCSWCRCTPSCGTVTAPRWPTRTTRRSLSQAPDASLARHWPRVLATLSDSFDVVGDGGDALDDEVWPFIAADGKQQGRSPSPPPPPTRDCRRAELTRAGVVQHLENGMVLGEAYRGPLGLGADAVAAAKAGTLRVVSTPYQRTVLSAATLVTGVFLSAAAVDDAPGDRAVDDDKVPIDLCHEESCLIFATRASTQRCPKVRI